MYTEKVTEDMGAYMTVQDFIDSVDMGMFNDDDGYGYPCLGDMYDPDVVIAPSEIYAIPRTATHIIWFNA